MRKTLLAEFALFGLVSAVALTAFSKTPVQTKSAKPSRVRNKSSSADAAGPGQVAPTVHMRNTSRLPNPNAKPVSGMNGPSGAPFCNPEPWSTSTTGPVARYRAGAVTDGTYIYVFGGGDVNDTRLNDLWRWDFTNKTWTRLANMPTSKQNIQGAYWNGKIYVPGGFLDSDQHITENAIYDIATNTWTTGAPIPTPQSGQQVAFNGKIYNFGGNPGLQTTTRIYDIATNTWSTGAPMPLGTTYGRATVAGQYAYYVGGIDSNSYTNAVYRYDFAANSWAVMAPLNTARTSEELVASPDARKLFAVMGGGDFGFFFGVALERSVEIYDIATNTWSYGNPVVITAAAPAGGLVGNQLMVQGGLDDEIRYDAVQVSIVPQEPCPTPTPTPTPISKYTLTASNGAAIVPGSTDIDNHCDDCSTTVALPFPFQFYDRIFTDVQISSNGHIQFGDGFANGSGCVGVDSASYIIAAHWSDLYTVDGDSGEGIFTSVSGTAPDRVFNIEWRTTQCCSGGTPTEHFEIRLHENDGRIDALYGLPGGGGIGLQRDNSCQFTAVSCGANPPAGTQYTFTPDFAPPPPPAYTVTTTTGASIVPGNTDIGNHCDDCSTSITLPFAFEFYDQVVTEAKIWSNGLVQFGDFGVDLQGCVGTSLVADIIAANWSDLYTVDVGSGQGIFTSVSGAAPDRVFNIEWRARSCCSDGVPTNNFEARLYEKDGQIDVIVGSVDGGGVGLEHNNCEYTAASCGQTPVPGTRYTFVRAAPVVALSAVSRKTHGGAGEFDVDLPLSGGPAVESRSGGANGIHQVIFTFANPLTSVGGASVSSGAGSVNSSVIGTDPHQYIVNLSNVANTQTIVLNVTNLSDAAGGHTSTVAVSMAVLIGDTNGDGSVNSADISQTKSQSGQGLTRSNFREDLNADGSINSADISLVKSRSGSALPSQSTRAAHSER